MRNVPDAEDVVRQAILADGPHAVIATDAEGLILHWNERAVELYGWEAQEVIGRNVLDVTPASMSQREAEAVMRALMKGEEWSGQFLVRRKDGTPVKVHVSDRPVLHEKRLIGIIGISTPSG